MFGVFKDHLNNACDKWLAEIASKGETRIDIATVFLDIYARSINHICFGKDMNDDVFDFNYFDVQEDSFTFKKVTMKDAVHNAIKQVSENIGRGLKRPFNAMVKFFLHYDLPDKAFVEKLN